MKPKIKEKPKKAIKYAPKVVRGGIRGVKGLFVEELRLNREKKQLLPEEVDRLLAFGGEFPTISEIEADPNLFSHEFQQRWTRARLDREDLDRDLFDLTGTLVDQAINAYLETSGNLQKTLGEFKESGAKIHGTLLLDDLVGEVERLLSGIPSKKPTKTFAPNMISPKDYARMHIFSCIMHELYEFDERKKKRGSLIDSIIATLTKFFSGKQKR